MNAFTIIGIILTVAGILFSAYGASINEKESEAVLSKKIGEKNQVIDSIQSNASKLIEQNTTLLQSTEKVAATNGDLIQQNTQMLHRITKYQSDIEEKNKQIELLSEGFKNIKDYQEVSKMTITGGVGSGTKFAAQISYGGDLNFNMTRITKFRSKNPESLDSPPLINSVDQIGDYFDLNPATLPLLDKAIELYPKFPFSYMVRAMILKSMGSKEWRNDAEKAIQILEITTSIPEHWIEHDFALTYVRQLMK